MPPKARITKEMIVDAAYQIVREEGMGSVNVRRIAKQLGCSTQPVMYCFGTVEEIHRAVYQKADDYHTACLMKIHGERPLLEIGLNYIRFAVEEGHLFQLLFQSDHFAGKGLMELMEAPELEAMGVLAKGGDISMEQARNVMKYLFLYVHGYASMLAGNSMVFDEKRVAKELENMFYGALCALQREEKDCGKTV